MLQAMNTGHDGSLSTVHANSPRDALARIETMVLMAGFDLPIRAIRQQVASALDLIVHLERLEDGSRRVTAITEVQRMESRSDHAAGALRVPDRGVLPDATVVGRLRSTGLRPTFVSKFEQHGIELPSGASSRRPRQTLGDLAEAGDEPAASAVRRGRRRARAPGCRRAAERHCACSSRRSGSAVPRPRLRRRRCRGPSPSTTQTVVSRRTGCGSASSPSIPAGEEGMTASASCSSSTRATACTAQPITKAVAAARTFAARGAPASRLGLVAFNRRVRRGRRAHDRRRSRSTPRSRVAAASSEATHIYDAAAPPSRARRSKDRGGIDRPAVRRRRHGQHDHARSSVVAARHGRPVCGCSPSACARARSAGARSRRSPSGTGGAYSRPNRWRARRRSRQRSAKRLANEYLVRYRSTGGAEIVHVVVTVKVRGRAGVADASLPARQRSRALPPFLRSSSSAVLACLAWPRDSRRCGARWSALAAAPARQAAPVAPASTNRPASCVSSSRWPPDRRRETRERRSRSRRRALERAPWRLACREGSRSPGHRDAGNAPIHAPTAVATLVALVDPDGDRGSGTGFVGLLVLFARRGALVVMARSCEQRRRQFAEQLPDNLQVSASALRAGHSFVGALSSSSTTRRSRRAASSPSASPTSSWASRSRGARARSRERMDNRDLEQVALVAALQRETGGNTAEVLDRVAETVREPLRAAAPGEDADGAGTHVALGRFVAARRARSSSSRQSTRATWSRSTRTRSAGFSSPSLR